MAKYINPYTDFDDDNSLNSSYISMKHIIETAHNDGVRKGKEKRKASQQKEE